MKTNRNTGVGLWIWGLIIATIFGFLTGGEKFGAYWACLGIYVAIGLLTWIPILIERWLKRRSEERERENIDPKDYPF